ncbi:flagellar hook assembly protein FlgD [Sphingomonas sp. DT-204]|uniref:flagellar hook assembly protein FlgD n=1 Tax=Sphingomonas sp. DT-204 TaxID=3396166 RepID=UPI003F1C62C0
MQANPISPTSPTTTPVTQASNAQTATNAFGLGFESLLKIILTQLTYQDPLKPMDNFQFVSQLAQFSQIQLGQAANDRLDTVVAAQGALQAVGLLGRKVDISSNGATLSGKVTAVAFENGDPRITIETDGEQTVSGLSLASVSQIREGQ